MARKGATQRQKDRGPQPSAVFLNEEKDRATLATASHRQIGRCHLAVTAATPTCRRGWLASRDAGAGA